MSDKEAVFNAQHPLLSKLYNMLPTPPQQGAPIDKALPYMTMPLALVGQQIAETVARPDIFKSIIAGLGLGPDSAFGSTPGFSPDMPFYKGVERQADQKWVIDPDTGYPIEVAGAPQHVRQSDLLPEKNETTLAKTPVEAAPPLPERKPKIKKATMPKEWTTIVKGLGPYASY